MRRLSILSFTLFVLVWAGCGGPEPLHDVSGTVTLDGKTVPAGMVYFDPDPTKGGSGPQGYAPIKNGKYDTAVEGKGVRGGGGYVVRVSCFDGKVVGDNPLGTALCAEYEMTKDLPREKSELVIDVPKKR